MKRFAAMLGALALISVPAVAQASVSSPVPAGPSTSKFEYWCSNEYTGHFGCDFYPSTAGNEFGVNANPYAWPGYAFIYNSTNLMLSNGSSGCLHVVKPSSGVDWMNVVTCHSYDKNQRWSFPNGGLEIKASGDVRCVELDFDVITGFPNGYGMAICNGSNSNQDWKWIAA